MEVFLGKSSNVLWMRVRDPKIGCMVNVPARKIDDVNKNETVRYSANKMSEQYFVLIKQLHPI